MNYSTIKYFDIANGEGVRTTLFVSGCRRGCPGCFNSEAWDFKAGKPFTEEVENKILESLSASYVDGITLLGGEPMEPENQRTLVGLLRAVRAAYPEKDVWCYTGYTLETDLLSPSRARCEVTDELLSLIDVLVDGEFITEKRNISLAFRGSENQRIIDLKATLGTGKTVMLPL